MDCHGFGGQQDDRDVSGQHVLLDAGADLQSARSGDDDVADDDVRHFLCNQPEGRISVVRVDDMEEALEMFADIDTDRLRVFDEKDRMFRLRRQGFLFDFGRDDFQ